jgi:hypothetical protein
METVRVPFSFIVQWDDRMAYWDMPIGWVAGDVRWGGRSDRGDDQDAEPVEHIPVGEFRNV